MRQPGKGLGRKPANIQNAAKSDQQTVWEAVTSLKVFTRDDITCWISKHRFQRVSDSTVRSYIKRLLLGGYIEVSETTVFSGCAIRNEYTLIRDVGYHAPRINKKGEPVTQGQGRQNLWRSMKILNQFTYRELAAAASTEQVRVADREAKAYVSALYKAGYLLLLEKSSPRAGRIARYRFARSKNTGPLPPQIQRSKSVFDPNLGEVVWIPKESPELI